MSHKSTQKHGILVPAEEPLVCEVYEWRSGLLLKIAEGIAEFCLVIVARLGHGDADRCRLGAAASPSGALLVVLDTRRHIATNYRLQVTNIHAKLHRGGAAEHRNLAISKVPLQPLPQFVVQGGGVLPRNLADILITEI